MLAQRSGGKGKSRTFTSKSPNRVGPAGQTTRNLPQALGVIRNGLLAEICRRVTRRRHHRPQVFVDATGVGQPIVDLLRDSTRDAAHIWAVTFTHGDRRTLHRKARKITLGKAHLVCRLQSLLEGQRLHLAATREARALVDELLHYEIRIDDNAHGRYGAFRVGAHDDLVTALGLAVQEDPPLGDRACP